MTRRLRALALVALSVVAAWVFVAIDAPRRRARLGSTERARALSSLVGVPDLALSSSARWLRHPSTVEPSAAVSDVPASLDVEPAGGLLAPPTELFEAGARDARRAP